MDNRKQQDRARETISTSAQHQQHTVRLAPLTEEEEKYLQSIEKSGSDVDRNVILGGPRSR